MIVAYAIVGLLLSTWSGYALAADAAASGVTVDVTNVASAIVAGVFSVLGIVIPLLISHYIKDQTAASTLDAAVKNSLGALQRAATGVIVSKEPQVPIPGVPATLLPGVQYVLDHAGEEAARLGITDTAIASKINAQLGLANIQGNIAKAAAPDAPAPVLPAGTVAVIRGGLPA